MSQQTPINDRYDGQYLDLHQQQVLELLQTTPKDDIMLSEINNNLSISQQTNISPPKPKIDWTSYLFPLLFSDPQWTPRKYWGDEVWDKVKPYVIGCGTAMFIQFFIQPVYNIKVAFQVVDKNDYVTSKHRITRKLRFLFKYLRMFGLLNLWRGFPTAFQGQFVANFGHLTYLHQTQISPKPLSTEQSVALTLWATFFASILYHPFDNVVVKQQVDVLLPERYQSRYTSFYHAIQQIFRHSGLRGLYRGGSVSIPKNLLHATTLFTAYPQVLNRFPEPNRPLKLAIYLAVAASSSFIYHPFDTIKTVLQATPYQMGKERPELFGSNWKIIKSYIKNNGVVALYRGLLPNMAITTMIPLATYVIVDMIAQSKILK